MLRFDIILINVCWQQFCSITMVLATSSQRTGTRASLLFSSRRFPSINTNRGSRANQRHRVSSHYHVKELKHDGNLFSTPLIVRKALNRETEKWIFDVFALADERACSIEIVHPNFNWIIVPFLSWLLIGSDICVYIRIWICFRFVACTAHTRISGTL